MTHYRISRLPIVCIETIMHSYQYNILSLINFYFFDWLAALLAVYENTSFHSLTTTFQAFESLASDEMNI